MTKPAAIFESLEAVASALFVLQEGQIIWANSAALALTAYATAQLSSMALTDLIAPEWREHLPPGGELEIVTAAGKSLPVNLVVRPAEIGGERVEIATLTDLRAHKLPALAPNDRESIYRRAIENSIDGFYLMTCRYDAEQVADFVFEDVNTQGERMSRFRREQLIGHSIRQLFPHNIANTMRAKYLRAFESQQVLDEEYEVATPDGVQHWFHHQIVPTSDGVAIFTRNITDRKRMESALRDGEENYQALLTQSNDGVGLFDLQGWYILANERLAASLGYTVEELIGKSIHDVVPSGERQSIERVMEALHAGKDLPLFERIYRRKDGSEFRGEVNVSLVRDAKGNPMYIQSIMRDITWRKAAEEALRESEERYRMISELISDYAYSFRIEPDGTPVSEWITDSFKRMTGYTPEEIDAKGTFALYAPGEDVRAAEDMRRVLAGEAGSAEYRIVTKWGETRWVRIFRKPVWDVAHDRVIRMYGVAQDITARKQSEDELRRSEEQYRHIAENATDMISRTSADDVRIYVSSACRSLLGYEPEELIGPSSPPLLHPDDVKVMENAWDTIDTTHKAVAFTCRLRHKNGEYSWFEVTGKAVLNAETGAIKEYIALSRDISNRMRMEAILKEQERLRFDLQKEQELNEVKSNLMRTISHEFRTPLSLIMTSTDFLDAYLDRLDPQRRQERLQAIRIQVKRLSDMLDDISFVVQGTLHHMVAHPSLMKLEDYCQSIVDEIKSTIGRNHRFSFVSDGQLVEGVADKALVMRILTNLLSNAIKYSPEQSLITVRLERVDADAVLQVSDQGIGITPEEQRRIFEPFYRGSGVIDSVGGTGLGLSIVEDCVDLHGGTISVNSVMNRGTTFIVRLPQIAS